MLFELSPGCALDLQGVHYAKKATDGYLIFFSELYKAYAVQYEFDSEADAEEHIRLMAEDTGDRLTNEIRVDVGPRGRIVIHDINWTPRFVQLFAVSGNLLCKIAFEPTEASNQVNAEFVRSLIKDVPQNAS